MKTKNEILSDFFTFLSQNQGIIGLTGGVYKNNRPTNSELEDTVIGVVSGNTTKFIQDGAVYIKSFYSDINNGDSYTEDNLRGQVIERLLLNMSTVLYTLKGYSFELRSRQTTTEAVPDIKQHYAILKINFKILY